jgi:diguanylate cyclase (GGDEF)-like protein
LIKFFPNLNSIKNRLILLGLVILLASTSLRLILLDKFLHNDIIRMSSADLQALAKYAAQDIDHNIVERRELLQRVAENLPLDYLSDPVRLRTWLGKRHEINPLFSQGLFVVGPDGKILTDYPAVANRVGLSCSDRDYFIKAMQGQFTIGCPVLGRASKVPVLPMGTSIRDKKGGVVAVLAGVSWLDSPNFMNTLKRTRIGNGGGLILVSPRDQLIVGSSRQGIALKPMPPKGWHLQSDSPKPGGCEVAIDVNISGVEELAAVVPVPSSGWLLEARLPTAEALAPLNRLRGLTINITAIVGGVIVIVVIVGVRCLLGPLEHAAQHADRMTREEIPLEPLPVVRNDEVGHLTEAFNRVLTKLLESRTKLEHLAHHDMLTGLPNRKLLADRLKQAFGRSQRNGTQITVMVLDLDGFKPINDELGHDAGDEALQQVASRLQGVVRCEDTVARVGGDEFAILLADQKERARETAELVAGKCLEVFSQPFAIKGQMCQMGASIGCATGNGDGLPDQLLIAADRAMYNAKEEGRGRIRWGHR